MAEAAAAASDRGEGERLGDDDIASRALAFVPRKFPEMAVFLGSIHFWRRFSMALLPFQSRRAKIERHVEEGRGGQIRR